MEAIRRGSGQQIGPSPAAAADFADHASSAGLHRRPQERTTCEGTEDSEAAADGCGQMGGRSVRGCWRCSRATHRRMLGEASVRSQIRDSAVPSPPSRATHPVEDKVPTAGDRSPWLLRAALFQQHADRCGFHTTLNLLCLRDITQSGKYLILMFCVQRKNDT